jgi:YidC/Oxa1 family membrane protein insertase
MLVLASSPFDPFFKLFASILAFFYAITTNYALAIILLTLLVMIVVTPLTLKGTRSMMMMQQLQPEMRKIQARYKDDRQKLNEELLKFYKENNINPLGGCLPLLVQMPVFLVLYQVLRGLTRRVSDLGSGAGWASGQFSLPGASPSKPPDLVRVFDPAWINPSTKMYQNLSTSTQMEAFGMDLSESASKALRQGVVHASPFLVLIAIVAVTGFVQQRQIQGRNPNATVNPQQQMIMKIMPIFLPVISFGLPAGLVLYFAVSNMYRIAQQAFISHSIYGGKANGMTWKDMLGLGKGQAKAKPKPTAKSSSKSASSKAAAKSKAIPASSKAAPKGKAPARTSSRSTSKAAAAKGSRPAPSKTSSRSTKEDQGGATPAPAPSDGGDSTSGSTGSTPTAPSEGATGAPPSLQPRARKKKR